MFSLFVFDTIMYFLPDTIATVCGGDEDMLLSLIFGVAFDAASSFPLRFFVVELEFDLAGTGAALLFFAGVPDSF